MAGLEVTLDHFPLVWIRIGEGATDADYQQMFDRLRAVMDRGQRFVCIAEARGLVLPSASQRKIIGDWYPLLKARVNELSTGQAVVLTTPLQRGAVTALTWLLRPDVPMAAFESRAAALLWCRERLLENAVFIPPAVSHLLAGGGAAAEDAG